MRRIPELIRVNDSVYLSSIQVEDAESYVKYLNDAEFSENTCSIPAPYLLSDAQRFISSVMDYEKVNQVHRDWAIRNKKSELIGGIGLLFDHGITSHQSQMGYWLAKVFWNQGIMTSVLKAFTTFIFTYTDLVRLEARVFSQNQASCRVLEKAGFSQEGYLRRAYKKDDVYIDAYVYAMIK